MPERQSSRAGLPRADHAVDHVDDGNFHHNLLQPQDMAGHDFYARRDEVQGIVLDVVEALGGSISGEHGIGRAKRAELARRKSPVELALMRELEASLDPKGVLNPGGVI